MAERVVLDPSEVASSRTEVDITPWLDDEGVDWGDAEIQAFMAQAERGEVPVDYRIPNRQISGDLMLKTVGSTTANVARQKIQAKMALFQREGGWLKRVTNAGGTVFCDVVNSTFRATSVPGYQSRDDIDLGASFTLEAIPDFYENEVTTADQTETTDPELIFELTGIGGDYPGRVRIVVDEDDGDDQRGLIWAFRSKNYSSAATAALAYEAEALQNLDTARILALSGASGGTAVTHGTISTNWTPVVGTNIGGTAFLTHVGTHRLFGRIYSTSGTTVQTRAVFDVGDLVNPAENAAKRLPGASNFYIVDYGELRLDQAPVGTHRWQGQIQAKGDVGTENFSVDRLWIVPVDEGMGVLSAPVNPHGVVATYLARSEFNTEAGAITGDSLAVGGAWFAVAGSDADDFSAGSGVATRTAVSDAASLGRMLITTTPSISPIDNLVRLDVKASAFHAGETGVVGRGIDSSNYVRASIYWNGSTAALQQLRIEARNGGSLVSIASPTLASLGLPALALDAWYTIQLAVIGSNYALWFAPQGTSLSEPLIEGAATMPTDGEPGIYDAALAATACARTYDNFAAWDPSTDAAMFASQSAQLTTDGHFREDSSGTAYGPVSQVIGDLPRIPPAGLEGRTTQVFLKGSRGVVDQLPDSGIDNISAQVFYRPSWLFVDDT